MHELLITSACHDRPSGAPNYARQTAMHETVLKRVRTDKGAAWNERAQHSHLWPPHGSP